MTNTFHGVCIFDVKGTHAGSESLSFLRKPRTFLVRFFSPAADEGKGRDVEIIFFKPDQLVLSELPLSPRRP